MRDLAHRCYKALAGLLDDHSPQPGADRQRLADTVADQARSLADAAGTEGWHDPIIDRIGAVIAERAERVG
jgi:hypothetical protein